ncbi:MAG: hypothetical protein LAT79_09960 [Kiritimatiellae bacterium]|nr:hypothetical protein [Kiritimatiellia bacterium]
MEDSLTKTLGALHKELRKRKLAPGGLDRSANLRIGGAKGVFPRERRSPHRLGQRGSSHGSAGLRTGWGKGGLPAARAFPPQADAEIGAPVPFRRKPVRRSALP